MNTRIKYSIIHFMRPRMRDLKWYFRSLECEIQKVI